MAIFNTVYGGEPKWKPWANTLAYYPLTSTTTVNDESGNGYNLTNRWSVTFGIYDGIDCAYINYWSKNALYSQNNIWKTIVWTQNFTYSVWAKFNVVQNNWIIVINNDNTIEDRAVGILNNKLAAYIYRSWTHFAYWDTPTTNTRYYITLTYNWTDLKIYQNWVEKWSVSTGGATDVVNILWIGQWTNWYVSNVIVEDKARTATEISDYYNKTKSNYWL